MIYFTADEHYGHNKILEYVNRPFNDAMQMECEFIRLHNSVVSNEDLVYHLGDFAMWKGDDKHRVERIFKQLNGDHVLILGNHDKLTPFQYVDIGFQSVHTSLVVEEFILVHDSVACVINHNKIWLCGHSHTHWKRVKNAINVGVDQWNYLPISIETIRKFIAEGKDNG